MASLIGTVIPLLFDAAVIGLAVRAIVPRKVTLIDDTGEVRQARMSSRSILFGKEIFARYYPDGAASPRWRWTEDYRVKRLHNRDRGATWCYGWTGMRADAVRVFAALMERP